MTSSRLWIGSSRDSLWTSERRTGSKLAMMVVEYIEALIPMPPFEVWTVDFLANREEYLLYAHTLHREGRLP